jgi:endonuclease/exonuclease/phosphatase family metal-dependent hydrolase
MINFLLLLGFVAWAASNEIMTYNIRSGFDGYNHFDLEGTAKAIREANVDLVALQEVDRLTNRCA